MLIFYNFLTLFAPNFYKLVLIDLKVLQMSLHHMFYLVIKNEEHIFAFMALLQKDGFFKLFSMFKTNLSPEDDVIAKNLMAFVRSRIFHFDFNNLIGFSLAIWESSKPGPYLERSKMRFFS